MSNGNRPGVKKITVEFTEGDPKVYSVEKGNMPEALFWSNRSVIDILGSYYDSVNTNHQMTYENFEKYFGAKRALAVCPGGTGSSVILNKQKIDTIWNTTNPDLLLPLMSKVPDCDIGG